MDDKYYTKITSGMILLVLLVLSFFLIKPFLLSLLFGLILAFIFRPLYMRLNKKIKSKNLSVVIICVLLLLLIVIPVWFLTPILVNQSIKIFVASQTLDIVTPLKKFLPQLFETEVVSSGITTALYSFITKLTNSTMNIFSDLILNFPNLFLQFLVVLFVFFFSLRDGESLVSYIQSLLPFSKETEKRLFKSTNDITYSVLYGQVILGILQGLVAGLGFFVFGVDNALFLTLLACLAGILPIVGTAIIWIPVAIYLLISGNVGAFFGVLIFGLASTIFESVLKPAFVAKRANVNSVVILLGMVGGIFFVGALGAIIGPLILSYLLIILDLYRDRKIPGAIIEPEKS